MKNRDAGICTDGQRENCRPAAILPARVRIVLRRALSKTGIAVRYLPPFRRTLASPGETAAPWLVSSRRPLGRPLPAPDRKATRSRPPSAPRRGSPSAVRVHPPSASRQAALHPAARQRSAGRHPADNLPAILRAIMGHVCTFSFRVGYGRWKSQIAWSSQAA